MENKAKTSFYGSDKTLEMIEKENKLVWAHCLIAKEFVVTWPCHLRTVMAKFIIVGHRLREAT